MSAAPAGWYAQPDGSQLYWDGRQWVLPARSDWPQDRPGPGVAMPQPYGSSGQGAYGQVPALYAQAHQGPHGAAPYGLAAPYGPAQGGYRVAPKNPAISLLASFFIPGLGTLLNGEVPKGVLFLVCYLVSWPLLLLLIGFPLLIGVWVWGMIDAYNGAQNFNRRHGLTP